MPHFIYPSPEDGHLGNFHFWPTMNTVTVNIQDLSGYMFSFLLGTYLGVELLDRMLILVFNLCKNCWTVFPSGHTILHSRQ